MIGLFSLILLATGFRTVDKAFPKYFADVARGIKPALSAHQGFLLEGLLGDLIAYIFGLLNTPPAYSVWLWWILGNCAIALSLRLGWRDGSFSARSILIVCVFLRVTDAALWIGKTDTFLIAALVLSANRRRPLCLAGSVLASFLHPFVSLVSAAGVVIMRYIEDDVVDISVILTVLLGSSIDVVLFHSIFPEFQGRTTYFINDLAPILVSGLDWGIPSFLVDIVFPIFALFTIAGGPDRYPKYGGGAAVVWIVGTGLLTSFLVLDHTRDASLCTIAASLVFMRGRDVVPDGPKTGTLTLIGLTLMLSRVAMPHYDAVGPETFRWDALRSLGCRMLDDVQRPDSVWIRPERCPSPHPGP